MTERHRIYNFQAGGRSKRGLSYDQRIETGVYAADHAGK